VGILPRNKGIEMNSAELQVLIQYLEAIRQEQKKTSDIIAGVGVLFLIFACLLLFWKKW
tara:strand:+ start:2134 stop:2310 length:177 start_codon:yes stop_codon:yes gene_type:complete